MLHPTVHYIIIIGQLTVTYWTLDYNIRYPCSRLKIMYKNKQYMTSQPCFKCAVRNCQAIGAIGSRVQIPLGEVFHLYDLYIYIMSFLTFSNN
jgi:hypothetical protein